MKNYWQLSENIQQGPYKPNGEMWFSEIDLDTEERYDKNPPENWHKFAFNYKYNRNGYRSREFDLNTDKSIILTLGCSFTCGVGVPFEYTWCEYFGNNFPNHTVYNAGLGGGSSDTVARLSVNMIPILKPDIVAILWPSMYRFESYCHSKTKDGTQFNGPWNADDFKFHVEDNNAYNNQAKNKLIVTLLKKIHGFKLVELELDNEIEKYAGLRYPKARDNGHWGIEWHRDVAKDFYIEYNKK